VLEEACRARYVLFLNYFFLVLTPIAQRYLSQVIFQPNI
jgi:hypothetical protein